MKKANFKFVFDNEKTAKIIHDSIKPEVVHMIPKTQIETKLEKNKFFLKIEAEDLSSLRAACNSYIRWIDTAYNVEKKVK
jgi:tRNA threonylcarbamoyladenosine modification (KEOPS) complex  Pcc1 subunit